MAKRAYLILKHRIFEGVNQAQTIALYQPLLQSVAYKILRCKADAEDIVQDTFVKWLSAEQEKIQNTKAYLIQAVRNNCLNHLNTLRKKKEEYLESIDLSRLKGKFTSIDFSHLDLETELNKALAVMHTKLEPLERAVYLLKEILDFDYESVQKAVNKKQEHCRQLLCRARKKLSRIEMPKMNIEMPKTSAWIESFRKACDLGNATELIAQLQKEITPSKKD
jgi:RNA polymerase sigma factor (sigma-70 family)